MLCGVLWLTPLSREGADLHCMVQCNAPQLPCLLVGSLPAASHNWVHFMIMFFTEDSKVG